VIGAAYVTGCVEQVQRVFGYFERCRCIEQSERCLWTEFKGGCDKNEVVSVDARRLSLRQKCHVEKKWW
jgi:hypothetical protein